MGARRFTTSGAAIDTSDIVLGQCAVNMAPGIDTDGTNWLVAWDGSGGLRGVRVSGGGGALDAPPGVLLYAPGTITSPAVVYGGGAYAVFGGLQTDLWAVRVSVTGGVTATNGSIVGHVVNRSSSSSRRPRSTAPTT
jgi:hypothetical protein